MGRGGIAGPGAGVEPLTVQANTPGRRPKCWDQAQFSIGAQDRTTRFRKRQPLRFEGGPNSHQLGISNEYAPVFFDNSAGAIRSAGPATAHSETLLLGYLADSGTRNAHPRLNPAEAVSQTIGGRRYRSCAISLPPNSRELRQTARRSPVFAALRPRPAVEIDII